MIPSVSWTPGDDAGGRQVQAHIFSSSGPLVLTGGDLWRFLMCQLVEAEYNLDAQVWMSAKPAVNVTGGPFIEKRVCGDVEYRRQTAKDLCGAWPPAKEVGRTGPYAVGEYPLWMWQGAQYRARRVIRSTRETSAKPTFRSAADLASTGPLFNPAALRLSLASSSPVQPVVSNVGGVMRIGPAVLILIGVLGVAALASGGYVAGEAVKSSYDVDREKARIAAETALRSQVVMSKLAQGQPVGPEDLIISAGRSEERNTWALPLAGFGAGVVAAGAAGVAIWRRGKKQPSTAS